eukprot:TRINITY_DN13550_c0_g1_i1.p1 TRINITY_DN13550_c0_g1~~TRINITY_DN13550_c0_g1_i1.p1  ORF type:complete len:330 (+),score=78.96 TRINITY_DN13550_c0_g1_i1:315-1304(+)
MWHTLLNITRIERKLGQFSVVIYGSKEMRRHFNGEVKKRAKYNTEERTTYKKFVRRYLITALQLGLQTVNRHAVSAASQAAIDAVLTWTLASHPEKFAQHIMTLGDDSNLKSLLQDFTLVHFLSHARRIFAEDYDVTHEDIIMLPSFTDKQQGWSKEVVVSEREPSNPGAAPTGSLVVRFIDGGQANEHVVSHISHVKPICIVYAVDVMEYEESGGESLRSHCEFLSTLDNFIKYPAPFLVLLMNTDRLRARIKTQSGFGAAFPDFRGSTYEHAIAYYTTRLQTAYKTSRTGASFDCVMNASSPVQAYETSEKFVLTLRLNSSLMSMGF